MFYYNTVFVLLGPTTTFTQILIFISRFFLIYIPFCHYPLTNYFYFIVLLLLVVSMLRFIGMVFNSAAPYLRINLDFVAENEWFPQNYYEWLRFHFQNSYSEFNKILPTTNKGFLQVIVKTNRIQSVTLNITEDCKTLLSWIHTRTTYNRSGD